MNTGSALARFTITLSQAVTEPVQVEWFTSDGTAKAGVDYAANKGAVVFAPGQTSKTVDILVYGRAVGTEDRSFFVEMLPPTNAILGSSIGECIIHVDTSGSTPVTQIIIPTGPVGPQGKSSYQSYLDTTTDNPPMTEEEWVESLKGDPAEIAEEVAPLIDVGNTVLTAQGTESLSHPDSTTVKAVARRVAYSSPAKIATVTLADGQNTIPASALVGDAVDFHAAGFVPRIYRSGPMFEPLWSINTAGDLVIESAVAGDQLYAVQYGTGSEKRPFAAKADFDALQSNISSIDGAAYIGNAAGVYDAVMHIDATRMRDGMIIYAKGRDAVSDGGGGWFEYRKTSTETVDGGIVFQPSTGTGRLIRIVKEAVAYNVKWWGAKGDGVTDDTAAVMTAYAYCLNNVRLFTLLFPHGYYLTLSRFYFEGFYNGRFVMLGAVFIGGAIGADNSQESIFEICNGVNWSISGEWTITLEKSYGVKAGNPNAYQRGFYVHAKGGLPSAPHISFARVSGMRGSVLGNFITVGDPETDYQTSELVFTDCVSHGTVQPLRASGSQTSVSLNNCTLASNPSPDITNTPCVMLINVGASVWHVGGNGQCYHNTLNPSAPPTRFVLMNPCKSTTYNNPYGKYIAVGVAFEGTSPLVEFANDDAVNKPSPTSHASVVSFEGCSGYLGAIDPSYHIVGVWDNSYRGKISLGESNSFYIATGTPNRTGYNIYSQSPSVVIACGKETFKSGNGFMSYPHGIVGGHLIHGEMLATSGRVSGQSVPASTPTAIKWNINTIDQVRTGRYQDVLDSVTGNITVPDAGIRRVRLESRVALDAGTIQGNMYLYRNGALYSYGVLANGTALLNCTIPDPVPGDVFSVMLNINQPSSLGSMCGVDIYFET